MQFSILRNRRLISWTPIISVFAIEGGNIGQIVRMYHERSAAGQSLISWVMIEVALLLWYNFYRVKTPDEYWTTRCTAFGCVVCLAVIASIAYWRYFV